MASSRKTTSPLPEIPFLLQEAIRNQRVVLLIGAGASKECKSADGQRPPDGAQLRNLLAEKFLGTVKEQRDLMTVAEMAIASGAGEPAVFDEIEFQFHKFEPSMAHRSIPQFRWRGIATTNYDTFIEEAYAQEKGALQKCMPFVKDSEPFDDRLRREQNSVALLKLHGCFTHRLDKEIPLVLSHEHYSRVSANRKQLMTRLQQWAGGSPLVFIGYSLSDSHIRSMIYDIETSARPRWYIVTPGADEHDITFWATKNIEVIKATFGDFMRALDLAVPHLFRVLAAPKGGSEKPYRKHFRSDAIESQSLSQSLAVDFEYVHAEIAFDELSPKDFYSGHGDSWGGIVQRYDFKRKAGEDLLYKAMLEGQSVHEHGFFLLQGAAGSGKTVSLRRAAFDAATGLNELVLWLRELGTLRYSAIQELHELTGKQIYLFIDSISNHVTEVQRLIREARRTNLPLTVIAAEREADWKTYCGSLEDALPPEIVELGNLSQREAEELIDLLTRHRCLGLLENRSRDEQVAAFMHPDRSDRQLLVALHELTQGKPFETIVLDEYRKIQPERARRMYLDVATMHQFGSLARAGTIARISGIRFEDYEKSFFIPLRNIVKVVVDPATQDYSYRTRHSRVAKILFGQACEDDENKRAQLVRIIEGLDIGYSSDQRSIDGVSRGRELAQMFYPLSPSLSR